MPYRSLPATKKPDCYRQAGAIQPLVDTCHPHPNFKRRRLVLSRGFRSITPRTKPRWLARVPLLHSVPSFESLNIVKEQSASALWSLSHENNPNKATVAKLGGIEPLDIARERRNGELARPSHRRTRFSVRSDEQWETISKLVVARMSSRIAMVQTPDGAVRVLSSVGRLYSGTLPIKWRWPKLVVCR